jgi:hypothetical protein
MNIYPVHYAPHHTGHLPLCGARHANDGGEQQLVMVTMLRDMTTCFRCIDQYEERAATPEQVRALADARNAIDEAMADIEEQVMFDEGKKLTLHAMNHMIQRAPWWALRYKFRIARAMTDLRALTLADLKQ